MSVKHLSSVWTVPEVDLKDLMALATSLSRRMADMAPEGMGGAISALLDDIATTTGIDNCQLMEFTESGSEPRVHLRTAATNGRGGAAKRPAPERWLVDRLARGELVVISRIDDLPREAVARREEARRAWGCSILGVPASFAGQIVCALVIDSGPLTTRWPSAVIERLQLLLEILGGAWVRGRNEEALRANSALIEQLNTRLVADNVYLKEELKGYHDFEDIVGESAPLRVALNRVAQVAPTTSTVLLLGQTGTGKELFARAVHERSRRHARPLVRVNCAALPPSLIESELFGHEKGAFTGAVGVRQGRFELADGGTIFLDEIGDLPPDIQVKFLRVLQEGEFERVGSSHTRRVDVRVIAATHRDLETAVAEGDFRADLYYRLSVYPVRLPSLQERREDIPRLVWFFIHRHQRDLGRRISKVPESVMDALRRHTWPGNVRELENVVERAMIASSGDTLQLDEPLALTKSIASEDQADQGQSDNLDAIQRAHIEVVLERCGGRINGTGNAADRLGIHPNTLRFRMKKLGVRAADSRERARPIAAR